MSEEAPPTTTTTPTPIASSNEKNLVVSFIQFIRHKVSTNKCTEDQVEALEVAVQCLESAFGLTDANYAFQPSKPLLDVFTAAEGLPSGENELPEPTQAEIDEANKLKEEGNDLMKSSQFDAAVSKYNEAIKLNRDPVYFCNRAAAYCRLEQYDLAIQDCRTALALDPKYSKAYGRMGLALSCQNRYQQAVDAYKKALELDPNQESFKNNLRIAEEKVKELEAAAQASGVPPNPFSALFAGAGGAGTADGVNFASLFSNPQMLNMAQSLMNDPNIQNMMGQLMAGGAGFGNIFQAGQQLAQQMQQTNPEFVEQLRRQFEGHGRSDGNNESGGNSQPDQQQG
ncbi:hypothetical protein KIN20_026212 [Parelaphostrongylus tenuis]|uniref:SGTA homodimerisation domain-containing protein n=1 Tax=Parelaphostrongylus tenuis TaxID=148309 RepID=A0AAD5NCG3_PARTN|nr:hypothetical protein KIN20_026212 [Parelaphostrongylus tenuis]